MNQKFWVGYTIEVETKICKFNFLVAHEAMQLLVIRAAVTCNVATGSIPKWFTRTHLRTDNKIY